MTKFDPDEDGVTHVNVYSRGRTELGRFLSNFALSPVSTCDGDFRSIEGYWYWLKTGNERLRSLSGYAAKKVGRSSPPRDVPIDDIVFRSRIENAIRLKLLANPVFMRKLFELDLPLVHYYVVNGEPVPGAGLWVVEWLEEVRKGNDLLQLWQLEHRDGTTAIV